MPGHRVGRAARVEQWRKRHAHRLKHAATDVDRFTATADHLRLALKYATPEQRKRLVTQISTELESTAEDLLTTYAKTRRPKQ